MYWRIKSSESSTNEIRNKGRKEGIEGRKERGKKKGEKKRREERTDGGNKRKAESGKQEICNIIIITIIIDV